MNRYRYEAADASGKVEAGHLEADSQSAAFAALRSRGLTALLVQVEGNQQAAGGSSLFSAKLSDNDLAWATRQLASLLGASLPLEAALSATVEQAEKNTSPRPWPLCAPMCAAACAWPMPWRHGHGTFRRSTVR